MTLTVDVISKETIKPSSPTPPHLRFLNLFLLDQFAPLYHVSIILFYYAADGDEMPRVNCLKKSLSEILPQFYPLAGRIMDNQVIDCNDEGVGFLEVRVHGELNQVLHHQHPAAGKELDQLTPTDNFQGPGPMVLLSIQASVFDCGGVAVGVRISHKLADAASLATFLGNWAALSRGADNIVPPKFEAATLFPSRDDIPLTPIPPGVENPAVISKTFVLDAANIAALKAKCSNNLHVKNPTRVVAVSALLWKCAMNMNVERNKKGGRRAVSVARIAVNLRRRMDPPLSHSSFGNIVTIANVRAQIDTRQEMDSLAGEVSKELRNTNSEYVRKLQGVEGAATVLGLGVEGEVEICLVSSWCGFPFYGVDFGWGGPVWVGRPTVPFKNCFLLMDTKCGRGVEVWAFLEKEDMAMLESDPEFVAFTSTTTYQTPPAAASS